MGVLGGWDSAAIGKHIHHSQAVPPLPVLGECGGVDRVVQGVVATVIDMLLGWCLGLWVAQGHAGISSGGLVSRGGEHSYAVLLSFHSKQEVCCMCGIRL